MDLSAVIRSIEIVAENVNQHFVIVIKSTVPPATCTKVEELLKSKGFSTKVV